MATQTEQIAELIQEASKLNETFHEKEEVINKKLIEFQEWKNSMTIVFSANHFVWNSKQETKLHTILKADNVEVNAGNGYDPATGIFTAPTAGYYNFSAKVFVSTMLSDVDYTEKKWHEDMIFNINRYNADKNPDGSGTNADKIGELWIGQVGSIGADTLQSNWNRNQASDSVNHYLQAGEKVCIEFVIWNEATEDDGVMASYTFSGHRIA
jgi:hypothetical protein